MFLFKVLALNVTQETMRRMRDLIKWNNRIFFHITFGDLCGGEGKREKMPPFLLVPRFMWM